MHHICTIGEKLLEMNTAHFKLKLRKERPREDSTVTIFLYANINKRVKRYSTNKSVKPDQWNEKKQEVKASAPFWNETNLHLLNYVSKAKNYIAQCDLNGELARFDILDNILKNATFRTSDYYSFVSDYIEKFKGNYSLKTIKGFKTHLKKLQAFRSKVYFDDIDTAFWNEYENYLKGIGNKLNTIHKQSRLLKKFLNKAIEFGVVRDNRLKDLKVRRNDGNRQYLSVNDVNRLQLLYDNFQFGGNTLKNVLRYFLFACYTSLRFSDVKELRYKDLKGGETINIKFQKTGKLIQIPLNDKAKSLLDKETVPNANIFRVYTNQITNRYLKEIMKLAGITKEISFHCARHTWATITLELTGDIALVSNVLGHSSIKTTQIYAKTVEKKKREAMQLWDKI